eukprot:8046031-Pyramimonas_sp.AAC.1
MARVAHEPAPRMTSIMHQAHAIGNIVFCNRLIDLHVASASRVGVQRPTHVTSAARAKAAALKGASLWPPTTHQ